MYSWEKKSLREERLKKNPRNPSFSSTLLDEIYRSIDEGDAESGELNLYRDTMGKKESNGGGGGVKGRSGVEDEEMASLRRACIIDNWMEKKVNEKVVTRRRQSLPELDRKWLNDHHHDHLLFSSTSSSSDSSSGGFSSSETESFCGAKSRSSCFAPQRPKPIRTSISVSARSERPEKPFYYEQRELHMFDDYHHQRNSVISGHDSKSEESFIKSKSKALKIYSNLKKMREPISPGGRLATFLNSLFTTGNAKKTKNSSSIGGFNDASTERKSKSTQASTCSSASSFSRSCLSKTSPASREKLRNGVKRSVSFCPVSVIVDEDCRPCGHKCLYEEDRSVIPVKAAKKIGRSPSQRNEEEFKYHQMEKSRRVEEAAARDILKGYHHNQKKNNDYMMRNLKNNEDEDDDDDEDDAASYSSSDLFELDHLAVIGNDRYNEELPVYETTHFKTNRAIANGLIM